MLHVLFVNDSYHEILPFIEYAKDKGIKISTAKTWHQAQIIHGKENLDAIIADEHLSDGNVLDLLKTNDLRDDNTPKVYITGNSDKRDLETIDYLEKPLSLATLQELFDNLTNNAMTNSSCVSPELTDDFPTFVSLVGESKAMQNVYGLIEKVAPTHATVFIIGHSGTGKELIAEAIHKSSKRAKEKYVAINCGAISSELISSALFGHERGSFTGAVHNHKGYFEQASGGTLFLDEITETSLDFQVKLLRVLETGKIIPVGGKHPVAVDVRVVASTNRNPEQAVRQGLLREDLFYRLMVFPIMLPLLKDRGNDKVILAKYFLHSSIQTCGEKKVFNASAINAIKKLDYPGNVRQLKNVIYRAYILADKEISAEHIKSYVVGDVDSDNSTNLSLTIGNTSLAQAEAALIKKTLKHYKYNRTSAAQALGINSDELNARIHLLEVEN